MHRFGRTLTSLRLRAVRSVGFRRRLGRRCSVAAIATAVAGPSRVRLIAKRRPFDFCHFGIFSMRAIVDGNANHFDFGRTTPVVLTGLGPEKRRSRPRRSYLRLRRWRRSDFVPECDCNRFGGLRLRRRPLVLLVRLAPQRNNVARTSHLGRRRVRSFRFETVLWTQLYTDLCVHRL